MKKYINPERSEWPEILKRPTQSFEAIAPQVEEIFHAVQNEGDVALQRYTKQFDGIAIADLLVSQEEMDEAEDRVSVALKAAIGVAKTNIEKFHTAQQTEKTTVETQPGVWCWQEKRPIQKVGLYIPGGTAPLFSTILMLAVPAKIAGCTEIVMCSPPNQGGSLHPVILYTARLCGVTKVYKLGGIQAIAAMTFGTATVPGVYKIFGPGNQYVTAAKQWATQLGIAIDMPAGPSELLVVADHTAHPSFVASDLLSQAEHGADSQVILITTDKTLLEAVTLEVNSQLEKLPRKAIAEKALANSRLIYVDNATIALDLINAYGPEHFIICAEAEGFYVENTLNAGSVFIGNYTPESAGDYASGTNHTLPTNGYTKQYSGVNLDSFLKSMTFQKITAAGIQRLGETIALMAEAEGLEGHKNAVTLRLEYLKNG